MCTVTFVPIRDTYFLSSNRDEKIRREDALPPRLRRYNETDLVYPRDAKAGGSWIAMKETGDAAVLLNGAFFSHVSTGNYRRSRGLLFLDIFSADRPSLSFSKMDLSGIEPFTMILIEKSCLYEFRWDGTERFAKQLPVNRPHIWSSATLYDSHVIKKREHWFASFLNRHPRLTQQDILKFHRFTGDGDKQNDLLMERDGKYATVSITSIMLNDDRGVMRYSDLKQQRSEETIISFLANTGVV